MEWHTSFTYDNIYMITSYEVHHLQYITYGWNTVQKLREIVEPFNLEHQYPDMVNKSPRFDWLQNQMI